MDEPPAAPAPAPSTQTPSELEGTIVQTDEAVAETRHLSIPESARQPEGAPKVPGYILTDALGAGAYAQVWKAWQVRTGKRVAIKVFVQPRGVNWLILRREVERLIALDKHPNIVSLLDADLARTPAYLVMELLEQGSLESCVKRGEAVPVATAVRWMEEICEALAYVHGKGMLHCDLKPANILLDEEGHTRVADFGQSRVLSESGIALGTLFYMAPEQALVQRDGGHLQPDVKWDIFALGRTMYALLTGRVPHSDYSKGLETSRSLDERLDKYRKIVARWPLKPVSELTEGRVDEDLSAIVGKCAAADPVQRYAAVSEVIADLQARAESRPVSPLKRRHGYEARKFLARNRALVTAGALGVLCLGVAYAVFERAMSRQRLTVAQYEKELKEKESRLQEYERIRGRFEEAEKVLEGR